MRHGAQSHHAGTAQFSKSSFRMTPAGQDFQRPSAWQCWQDPAGPRTPWTAGHSAGPTAARTRQGIPDRNYAAPPARNRGRPFTGSASMKRPCVAASRTRVAMLKGARRSSARAALQQAARWPACRSRRNSPTGSRSAASCPQRQDFREEGLVGGRCRQEPGCGASAGDAALRSTSAGNRRRWAARC